MDMRRIILFAVFLISIPLLCHSEGIDQLYDELITYFSKDGMFNESIVLYLAKHTDKGKKYSEDDAKKYFDHENSFTLFRTNTLYMKGSSVLVRENMYYYNNGLDIYLQILVMDNPSSDVFFILVDKKGIEGESRRLFVKEEKKTLVELSEISARTFNRYKQ